MPASWACTRTSSPARLGLSSRRAEELRAAGLDHVQISIQADEAALSDRIAGMPSFERKLAAARLVKKLGWPLTLNVVLHRHNVDRIGRILALAEQLGADRIELANTQYYGWARRNRDGPAAEPGPARARGDRGPGRARAPAGTDGDHLRPARLLQPVPQALHGRLGRRQLTVVPNGDVLPCPTAHEVPLPRASVREHALAWIWEQSPALPVLPRYGLDAGSLPELRPPRTRLRRLPLPGVPAHRRRRAYRPGLPSVPRPRDCGRRGAGGRWPGPGAGLGHS